MRKQLVIALLAVASVGIAQEREKAEKLVDEGVAYHDKGDFEGAVDKYDKALANDKDNLSALAEKALTLVSLKKFDESIACCKAAIEKHPGDEGLRSVYVSYGNALDGLKKTDQSIEVYNEGLKQFPGYYQLHFNKGVSLSSVKKYEEALLSFQKSALCNPKHASTHNAIARLNYALEERIPAILAYCRFLAIEPTSERAQQNLETLKKLMQGNAEKTGKKSVTIHVDPKSLDTTNKEDNFSSVDLMLSLMSATDLDKKNRKKNECERFNDKLSLLCTFLKEQDKNRGFYWEYYAPYFREMYAAKQVESFSYIAFASSTDEDVKKWLKSNKDATDAFFAWSKGFTWKTL